MNQQVFNTNLWITFSDSDNSAPPKPRPPTAIWAASETVCSGKEPRAVTVGKQKLKAKWIKGNCFGL